MEEATSDMAPHSWQLPLQKSLPMNAMVSLHVMVNREMKTVPW
jgi:hypothetical protein